MKTNKISFTQNNKKRRGFLSSKKTGYAATGAVILAAASGISKNKKVRTLHKFSAALSGLLICFHIYSVEANKKLYKKQVD